MVMAPVLCRGHCFAQEKKTMSGYTGIPNEMLEHLSELSGTEAKVLLAVARQTTGWNRQTCPLAASWVAQLAGVHERTAVTALDTLVAKGLLFEGALTPVGRAYGLVKDAAPMQEIPDKENNIKSTNVDLERRDVRSLRDRVLTSLYEARNPVTPQAKGSNPQARTIRVLYALWELLYGNGYNPEPAMLGKMVSAYGGFKAGGPERLATKMLDLAGRDWPGGPALILMSDARKSKQEVVAQQQYQVIESPSFPVAGEKMNWDLE
jgi:phage replication O-like protein O